MKTFKLSVVNNHAGKAALKAMQATHINETLNSDGVCAILTDQDGKFYTTKRVLDTGLMVSSRLSQSGLEAFNISRMQFK